MNPFNLVEQGDFSTLFDEVEESSLEQLNQENRGLLHVAIANKEEDIALKLIEIGIHINQKDKNGQTPLHFAADFKLLTVAKAMLEKGANPDEKDKHGNTPLWKATFNARGEYEMVQLLLAHGANPNLKNDAGRSSVDFARQIEDEPLIELLTKS